MTTLDQIHHKITTASEVATRPFGEAKTVFTNGCFDLIHTGHITYLSKAADLGERFIVGLNSDRSVKALKGESRPIKDQMNRALVLASFSFIDQVVIFDEDTPLELIDHLQPDVQVKGGDYDPSCTDPEHPAYIVGSELTKSRGGEVVVIPFVEGHSTTNLINNM